MDISYFTEVKYEISNEKEAMLHRWPLLNEISYILSRESARLNRIWYMLKNLVTQQKTLHADFSRCY